MDTNRMFTSLFGGWLTAADKAAAATINYTKSTVLPRVSDLTQKATLATGKKWYDCSKETAITVGHAQVRPMGGTGPRDMGRPALIMVSTKSCHAAAMYLAT